MPEATNPFDVEQKTYINFPNDVYIEACILSYQIADLPPGPLATTNDPVPSARFLMGGYVKDEDGNWLVDDTGARILVRKWTRFMRISNSDNSAMSKTFQGFDNLTDILKDCQTTDGRLWTTPMKILLEQSDKYQNIIRIKPGDGKADVVTTAFYDDKYIPYKIIKAYGKPQALRVAGCKFKDGVKTFDPETMADAPQDN